MKNSHSNVDPKQLHSIVLSLEQYQATELLAIGKTDVEVAQLIGVANETIYQWRQKPQFMLALDMLCAAVSEQPNNAEVMVKEFPCLKSQMEELAAETTLVDVARFA